jgi:hypothetical protein
MRKNHAPQTSSRSGHARHALQQRRSRGVMWKINEMWNLSQNNKHQ